MDYIGVQMYIGSCDEGRVEGFAGNPAIFNDTDRRELARREQYIRDNPDQADKMKGNGYFKTTGQAPWLPDMW